MEGEIPNWSCACGNVNPPPRSGCAPICLKCGQEEPIVISDEEMLAMKLANAAGDTSPRTGLPYTPRTFMGSGGSTWWVKVLREARKDEYELPAPRTVSVDGQIAKVQ